MKIFKTISSPPTNRDRICNSTNPFHMSFGSNSGFFYHLRVLHPCRRLFLFEESASATCLTLLFCWHVMTTFLPTLDEKTVSKELLLSHLQASHTIDNSVQLYQMSNCLYFCYVNTTLPIWQKILYDNHLIALF